MARIIVDEREYEIKDGQNMLQAVLSVGLDLPYFCWHPAMGSIGACRQCAVRLFRDANDTRGKLAMACMTPAGDGTRISIEDAEARDFRASVIEWMMVNHPHDCPVCDEGGECHLQDMTLMTGHDYRRYRGRKRTFRNQDMGPFVRHEMNRCIQCYRCVRFYRDLADGRDFDVLGIRSQAYYGRQFDGVLESEFSGNLVEVCPTGVFTDKTLKEHYTRKWDLQTAPSVCVHCGLGCNTIPAERYGTLRRIYNRYNGEVNGYFICDRGRFGYEFVNGARRILRARLRAEHQGEAKLIDGDEALGRAASLLSQAKGVIGIGSPRASLEANFALRTLVEPERFCAGLAETDLRLAQIALDIMRSTPTRLASLADVARSDAALVLGEDVTQTAPMLAFALRQSVRQGPLRDAAKLRIPSWDAAGVQNATQGEKGPLYVAAVSSTRLDDIATQTYRAAPDDIARLGFAVAHAIDSASPPVPILPEGVRALVREIAGALLAADEPVIVSGSGCGSEAILRAAANVARALCRKGRPAKLCLAPPECDSNGLALLGGASLEIAFEVVASGEADTVVVVENDLYRRAANASVDALFSQARSVIVIDHTDSETAERADVVLPAAAFSESDGALVNNEGRAQRFYQVMTPTGDARDSWRWLQDMAVAAGRAGTQWANVDDVDQALAAAEPVFEAITEIAPPEGFRVAGERIARQTHRFSGRTAMFANVTVHEQPPPDDVDAPLAFSMEGYQGQPPSALIPRFWSPGWNSVQALNKFQEEIAGPLRGGDPGRRLIEPADEAADGYLGDVPRRVEKPAGDYLFVSLRHIFGSEELSALAPAIARLAPEPYAGLNYDDARGASLTEGHKIEVSVAGWSARLPVKIVDTLPSGIVALPLGLAGMPWLPLPAWGELRSPGDDKGAVQ